jgi:hypothetical protein
LFNWDANGRCFLEALTSAVAERPVELPGHRSVRRRTRHIAATRSW